MTTNNILISGIIHVCGEPDTGKTTFALECGAHPSRICFLDDDVKGRATVNQLTSSGVEFGAYHDLAALASGKTELDFYAACMKIVDAIKPRQFDAIIWDTWTNFQKTLHPYVLANRSKFRATWAAMGQMKGAQEWQEAQRHEAAILNQLQSKAKVVIIVTHLKDYYEGSKKVPGKQIPAASKTMTRVPVFRIWLRPNPASPVPIGLVLKRVDVKKVVEDKGVRTVSVLPRKIVPRPEDQSLWDTIRWYFEHPAGEHEPTENEIPDAFELSILNSTLTLEQRHLFELMLNVGALEESSDEEMISEDDIAVGDEVVGSIIRLSEEGKKPIEISKELGVEMKDVLKVLHS